MWITFVSRLTCVFVRVWHQRGSDGVPVGQPPTGLPHLWSGRRVWPAGNQDSKWRLKGQFTEIRKDVHCIRDHLLHQQDVLIWPKCSLWYAIYKQRQNLQYAINAWVSCRCTLDVLCPRMQSTAMVTTTSQANNRFFFLLFIFFLQFSCVTSWELIGDQIFPSSFLELRRLETLHYIGRSKPGPKMSLVSAMIFCRCITFCRFY